MSMLRDDLEPLEGAVAWTEIISADDSVVANNLMAWAGIDEAWSRCEERWCRHSRDWDYDFMCDVADCCASLHIERTEYDNGTPGRSGTWYKIESALPEDSKREIRAQLAQVLSEWRKVLWKKGPRPPKATVPSQATTFPTDALFFDASGLPVARLVKCHRQWKAVEWMAYDVPGGRRIANKELKKKVPISRQEFELLLHERN